ncbi:MAG: hypothetical protein M0D54_02235 [Hyphomonadaceae bacterium JAD_PAG50586_4]|nr:MAG: hypothetical protein M0D54_02235 [Hyphomonadaceae bacterium JAD_PAG50586_4]
MTQAEEKEEEGAFGPGPKCGRTDRGDDHQTVDAQPAMARIVDRFQHREVAAKSVGGDVEEQGQGFYAAQLSEPAQPQREARSERKMISERSPKGPACS